MAALIRALLQGAGRIKCLEHQRLLNASWLHFLGANIMIVRRRTWMYRLTGQLLAQSISFRQPVTESKVREALRRSVGTPLEIWGRSSTDLLLN
jgi:hypothetical protein